MTHIAYLRVSTDAQDTANQKHGILEYCNDLGLSNMAFVEDTASGTVPWQQRKLGKIIENSGKGDVLVFAEISRIGRTALQVLEVLKDCNEREIHIHVAKQRMVLDGSLNSTITATVLGLAAQIEREFISVRTKEALAARRAKGLPLGRPKGKARSVKLDEKESEIRRYLKQGISKRDIAKLVEVTPNTVYAFLKRRNLG